MSPANVEIVKRGIDAFNRRDLNAYDDLFTPDFEWLPAFPGTVEGDGYMGRAGIESYFGEISDTWQEFRAIAEEYRDLGDRVLLLGRFEGRGKGSGVPVDAPLATVYDFRQGKMSRCRGYLDHGAGFRAAGLAD
jgi:ketosteroid isomerase-like protein